MPPRPRPHSGGLLINVVTFATLRHAGAHQTGKTTPLIHCNTDRTMSDNAAARPFDPRAEARRLIRSGRYASLGTLERQSGAPYVSLVSTATDVDGAPLLLISTLAVHTRNLEVDPLASILFADVGAGDPVTHPRVSVLGRAEKAEEPRVRRRFLARHGQASFYAGFADFSFWRIVPTAAHLVAGFGRIVDLAPEDLLLPADEATALAEAEAEAIAHMNEDHRDALNLYATRLLGRCPGDWAVTGIDPEGLDLARSDEAGDEAARLVFPDMVKSPGALRQALRLLAEQARAKQDGT
jgi:heme iron utilization protein